jgi:molecular chaperone HscA
VSTLLQIHEPGATPAPHEEERGIAIGIDLGTTNSVAAIAEHGKPEILRDDHGDGLMPSVVAFKNAEPKLGRGAAQENNPQPAFVVLWV